MFVVDFYTHLRLREWCEDDQVQEEAFQGRMLGLYRDQDFSAQRGDKILGGDLYRKVIKTSNVSLLEYE